MVRGALVDMLVCERRNIHSHMHGMSSGLYRGGSLTDWCLQVCLRRVATKVWVEWGWAAGGALFASTSLHSQSDLASCRKLGAYAQSGFMYALTVFGAVEPGKVCATFWTTLNKNNFELGG